jgi:hypothetical protein
VGAHCVNAAQDGQHQGRDQYASQQHDAPHNPLRALTSPGT